MCKENVDSTEKREPKKVYIVCCSYDDVVVIRTVFSNKEEANNYVGRYNEIANQINTLVGYAQEEFLYIREEFIDNDIDEPQLVYVITYIVDSHSIYSTYYIDDSYIYDDKDDEQYKHASSYVSLEDAINILNTKCSTNFTLEDLEEY